ncbi:MAG: hypothetical protein NC400_15310 [Clostridium sp.]|nr:hypothetical protein [Clostridium sp.]
MVENEKLDLILSKLEKLDTLESDMQELREKMSGLDEKVTGLEKDMVDVKADLRRLHRDDTMILDEVERVHEILSRHTKDTTRHTA